MTLDSTEKVKKIGPPFIYPCKITRVQSSKVGNCYHRQQSFGARACLDTSERQATWGLHRGLHPAPLDVQVPCPASGGRLRAAASLAILQQVLLLPSPLLSSTVREYQGDWPRWHRGRFIYKHAKNLER